VKGFVGGTGSVVGFSSASSAGEGDERVGGSGARDLVISFAEESSIVGTDGPVVGVWGRSTVNGCKTWME